MLLTIIVCVVWLLIVGATFWYFRDWKITSIVALAAGVIALFIVFYPSSSPNGGNNDGPTGVHWWLNN